MRRLSIRLLNVAGRILPPSRRAWARDMRAEIDFIESDFAALNWAVGCVLASVRERGADMLQTDGQISRWVLVLEWLTCFVPLTLIWGVAVVYMTSRGSAPPDVLVPTLAATLGPVALIVSLVATLSAGRARVARFASLLAIGFLIVAVLQLVPVGMSGRIGLQWFQFKASLFVLFTLLPLAGCLHLNHLSRQSATAP